MSSVREIAGIADQLRWPGSRRPFASRTGNFLVRPTDSCFRVALSLMSLFQGLNGLDLQKRVAAERTDMPIIFITGHGDVPMTVQAMKAGAVEFLTKTIQRRRAVGGYTATPFARSHAALGREAEIQALRRPRYASLTSREREVYGIGLSLAGCETNRSVVS